MKKYGYLVIAGLLFSQPLLVSATEMSESNTQTSVEITEQQEENSTATVTPEKEDNPVASSERKETEQTDVPEKELAVTKEENIPEKTNSIEEVNEQGTKSGSVHTDDYDWDEETGTLTVKKGEVKKKYPDIQKSQVKKIIFNKGVTFPKDSSELFKNYYSVESIEGLENINTSNVTDMSEMFFAVLNTTSLDVSHFDTSNVTNMDSMFWGVSKLTSLDVSRFDTSNVTNMNGMFGLCSSLTSLDISHFDTSNVTDMGGMFMNAEQLTDLDVSRFDTSNVTNMAFMFFMTNIINLDVSYFDTFKVTNMAYMFSGMPQLKTLNINSFDTSSVTNKTGMLLQTNYLSKIILGKKTRLDAWVALETLKEGPEYTGNWSYIEDADGNKPSNPLSLSDAELMNYDGTYPGTYVWEKKQGQPVKIQYVDEVGKVLSEATELTGPLGEPYEAQAKEIEGYVLDEEQLPENGTGTFTDQKQTVTFVYKKAPVKAGDVTVRYVDEEGNEISEAIVMSGHVGDSYNSEQKDFPGYTLKEVKGATSGTFGIDRQLVTYVYQKEASSTNQSTTSNDKKPTNSTTPTEKGAASNGQKPKESGSVPPIHAQNGSYTKEGRKNRKLPQTNEQLNILLAAIGFSLIILVFISSIWYKKYRVSKNK